MSAWLDLVPVALSLGFLFVPLLFLLFWFFFRR